MLRPPCVRMFALLAAVSIGCSSNAPPAVQIPPPPVSVSKAIEREVVNQDTFEGTFKALNTEEIRARVKGHLLKVHFKDGQMVKKGDPLYDIDPEQYLAAQDSAKAQLAAAEAELTLAKAEYTRTKGLAAKGAASREELDIWTGKQGTAIAARLKALAAIRQADDDVKHTKIVAPIDGRISRTLVDEGNLVNAGGVNTLLTTLVSVDPIHVYFDVSERALAEYRNSYAKEPKREGPEPEIKELKIPVEVAIEGDNDFGHKGLIDFADNRVNPSTGTKEVGALLPNGKRIFEGGMRARVRVPVSDTYKAVLVTDRAVGSEQGRKFVYVVKDGKIAERRDVTLGRIIDGLQVIATGLKPGELVIVNGIQRVRDGQEVNPHDVPMPDDLGPTKKPEKSSSSNPKEGGR
jgi:RND family efflux transporter MFP subunit